MSNVIAPLSETPADRGGIAGRVASDQGSFLLYSGEVRLLGTHVAVLLSWMTMMATGCGSEALKQAGGGQGGGGGHGAGGVADGGASGAGAAGQGGSGGRGAAGTGDGGAHDAGAAGQGDSATASTGGIPGGGGGAGGASSTGDGVACLPVTVPLITDFTYVPDGGSPTTVQFGDDTTTFSGGEFVYPTSGNYVVTSDVTGNNWHISGTIGDYSGFGLSFDRCSVVDASAYKGISFTLSGVVAAGSIVTMDVGTLNDTIAASWLNAHGGTATADAPGRCIPTSGTTAYAQSSCLDPTDTILITSIPTTINLMWSDFSGGRPEASVNPSDILTIYWYLPPPPGVGTSSVTTYTADITIDNLKFIQ